jgi:hypothetical protein
MVSHEEPLDLHEASDELATCKGRVTQRAVVEPRPWNICDLVQDTEKFILFGLIHLSHPVVCPMEIKGSQSLPVSLNGHGFEEGLLCSICFLTTRYLVFFPMQSRILLFVL